MRARRRGADVRKILLPGTLLNQPGDPGVVPQAQAGDAEVALDQNKRLLLTSYLHHIRQEAVEGPPSTTWKPSPSPLASLPRPIGGRPGSHLFQS